jgi:hypothetical protein
LVSAQSSLDAPGEKKITIGSEIARGTHEIGASSIENTDIQFLQKQAHMNEVISRNKSANTDSDGFMLGARLRELCELNSLIELVETNQNVQQFNSAADLKNAKEELKRYASEIRALEKKLGIDDDQLIAASNISPNESARPPIKALIVRCSQ